MNGLARNAYRKESYAFVLREDALHAGDASAAIEFRGAGFLELVRRELAAAWAAAGCSSAWHWDIWEYRAP
jgi:hypothetical protein